MFIKAIYSKLINMFRIMSWEYLKGSRLKILFSCLIIYCLLLFVYNYINMHPKIENCHDDVLVDGVPDVLNDNEDPPPKGRSIFFHETSCNFARDKILRVTPRQACAVESAALHNPNSTVYLLYSSSVRFPNASEISLKKYNILNELLKYSNIKIRRVLLSSYIKNTPLEEWYVGGQLKSSMYFNFHTSDVLRYLSLWKFGGTYLDLDVVVLKNLNSLKYNYAGAEDGDDVDAGIINLDHENAGHILAEKFLQEISTNFKGDDWGHNGPGVITRVLRKYCGVNQTNLMKGSRCHGFTVHKPYYFYPIHWKNWNLFFNPRELITAFNVIRDSYIIHVWNKFSYKTNVMTREKDVAYGVMARTHCPNVFRESGDVF